MPDLLNVVPFTPSPPHVTAGGDGPDGPPCRIVPLKRRGRKPQYDEPLKKTRPRALKRCRFCNAMTSTRHTLKVIDPSGGEPYFAVHCPSCEARGPVVLTAELAGRYWNHGMKLEPAEMEEAV